MLGMDEEGARHDQKNEGHQLDDCRHLSGGHPAAGSANIQPGKSAIHPDNQPGPCHGHCKPGDQNAMVFAKSAATAAFAKAPLAVNKSIPTIPPASGPNEAVAYA